MYNFTHACDLQLHLVHLSATHKPAIIPLGRGRANCIQLIKEGRYEAARSADVIFGSSILGGNLEHQQARQHGKELVRAMGSQEAT